MIEFRPSATFRRQFDRLHKKYKSLLNDYEKLKSDLCKDPKQGVDLGNGMRKVRMAIASKNKGKSGGARIITYVEAITAELNGTLTFLYIYDKSEMSNISDSKLKEILETEEII